MKANSADKDRRVRSEASDRSRELSPWVKAKEMTKCALYWIPVDTTPYPELQRKWLMSFIDRLVASLARDSKLRPESFLKFKSLYPHLSDNLMRSPPELIPMMGLTRKPASKLPEPPSENDIIDLQKGRKKFDFNEYLGDYSYFFLSKNERKIRELFFGFGGMTMLFIKPDPNTTPPPLKFPRMIRESAQMQALFREFNPQHYQAAAHSLRDGFLQKSKQLFGKGLENDPQFKGLMFILPLLASSDFFHQPSDTVSEWFELFDLYLNESVDDRGLILAAKDDLDEVLVGIVTQMRSEGFNY